jgi:hypothetical protein
MALTSLSASSSKDRTALIGLTDVSIPIAKRDMMPNERSFSSCSSIAGVFVGVNEIRFPAGTVLRRRSSIHRDKPEREIRWQRRS